MNQPGRCDFCLQPDHDLRTLTTTSAPTLHLCQSCEEAWLDRWAKEGLHP